MSKRGNTTDGSQWMVHTQPTIDAFVICGSATNAVRRGFGTPQSYPNVEKACALSSAYGKAEPCPLPDEASSRLSMNNPPTAVGGISAF